MTKFHNQTNYSPNYSLYNFVSLFEEANRKKKILDLNRGRISLSDLLPSLALSFIFICDFFFFYLSRLYLFVPIKSCILSFPFMIHFLAFIIFLPYFFTLLVFITQNSDHVLHSHILPTLINVSQKSQRNYIV
jgi:polyferredoxin